MNNNRETIIDYLSPEEKQLLEEIKNRAKENQNLISRLPLHELSQIDSASYTLKKQIESDKKQLNVLKQKAAMRIAIKKAKERSAARTVNSSQGKFYGFKNKRVQASQKNEESL